MTIQSDRREGQTDQMMVVSSAKVRLYIQMIFALCALLVVFVLGIAWVRKGEDAATTTAIIATIVGVLGSCIAGFMAAALRENHDAMNSRLSQLLALTEKSAKAEGKLEGA